jgi:hypothetical protein
MPNRYQDLQLLNELSSVITIKSYEEKTKSALKIMCNVMSVDYGKLLSVKNQHLEIQYIYDNSLDEFIKEERPVLFDIKEYKEQGKSHRSISGHVASSKEMVIIENIDDFEYKQYFAKLYIEEKTVNSEIVAPIYYHDSVQWVLCLSSCHKMFFQSKHKSLYLTISNILSSLLTEGIEREQNVMLQDFNKLINTMWSSRKDKNSYGQAIQNALNELCHVLNLNTCRLFLSCPGDYDHVLLHSEKGKEDYRLTYVSSFENGFIMDDHGNLVPNKDNLALRLFDHNLNIIGYLICNYSRSIHTPFIESILRQFKSDIEAMLKEERTIISSFTRECIITYDKKTPSNAGFDRFQNIKNHLEEMLDLYAIHFWVIDGDTASLDTDPTNHSVEKHNDTLVNKVWQKEEIIFKYGISKYSDYVVFADIIPDYETSWVGYPVSRSGNIFAIICCIGKEDRILTVQDIPSIEIIAIILTLEIELQKTTHDLFQGRSIESHQISAHLHNAYSKIALMSQIASKNHSIRNTRIPTHLKNLRAFLRLSIRSLNLEGRNIDEITDFNPKWQSIQGCIAETVSMVRAILFGEEKDIKIKYDDIDEKLTYDYTSLQEALLAVLLNASKYSLPGTEVRISFIKEASPVIVINNMGIGIQEGDVERIFERNYQGQNVTIDMALDFEKGKYSGGCGKYYPIHPRSGCCSLK